MPKHSIQSPNDYRYLTKFLSKSISFFLFLSFRILLLGDSGVGKTSLIARYIRNEYPCQSQTHINTDGSTIYPTVIDGNDCRLIFIDFSTVYDFQKYRQTDTIPTACFIMFSITDQRSFSRLNFYYDIIRSKFSQSTSTNSLPIIIIGNKIDLEPERVIHQQSMDKIKSHGYDVFDVSVKGNVGIGDAVYTAIKHLQYDRLEKLKSTNACACVIS